VGSGLADTKRTSATASALATRSGWCKPAVVWVADFRIRNAHQQQHPRWQPRAAGVSQPWERVADLRIRNAHQQRHPRWQPGAAGVSQPWDGNRSCRGERAGFGKVGRRCRRVFRYHGGLTPAALAGRSHRGRMVGDFRRTASGLPTHGGLTPAALVRSSRRRRMVGDFRRSAFGLPNTAG
jgi:hypothetical protein